MDDVGVKIVFKKETSRMVRGEMVLWKGVRIGTLYMLLGINISDRCNSSIVPEIGHEEKKNPTISREKSMMRHQILGHIRDKRLQVLHGKGMVEGMYKFSMDFDLCENYVYVKKNQVIFPSGAMREEVILDLVHNDVFGPVSVPSLRKTMSHLYI
jgi:hypothetical protein